MAGTLPILELTDELIKLCATAYEVTWLFVGVECYVLH